MLTTAGASVLQRRLALSRTLETAVGCLSTSMRERLSGVVLIVLFAALVTAALSAALFLIITRLSSGEGGDSSARWSGMPRILVGFKNGKKIISAREVTQVEVANFANCQAKVIH